MNKGLIVTLIILLVFAGLLVFVYLRVEAPYKGVTTTMSNLSISAEHNGDRTVTGYQILSNTTTVIQEGKTLKFGALLSQIPSNQTIMIRNKNLEDQNYYTTELAWTYLLSTINYRFEINLVPSGSISATYDYLDRNKLIIITNAQGEYRNVGMCMKWGLHVLAIEFEENQNYQIIENPKIYQDYDKCYTFGVSLDSEEYRFPINYVTWGVLDNKDYIDIAFFDGDEQLGEINYETRVDNDFLDIAGENYVLHIPIKEIAR